MIKKYLISIIIINILVLPFLAQAQTQTEPLIDDAFEDLGRESKPIGETIWQTVKTEFPKMIKRPWQDALTAWKMIFNWIKSFWNSYLSNWFKIIWENLVYFLGKEVEQRRPEIEQEFIKETEEMKQDIPETAKSLWERFKGLIQ
ncbi:MAG: hypothetical protein A2V72_01240 [Candidatus Nealsonbacteria bacterium RBG_13_37_56]|uniref:Uncharacterized protein n=1 Tax=Candidatus Nealsonbacteria bacterium RBG_13_37_56 TaxID=1801661 RepID=A0A1G2DWP7_9BACT|nr:MAG: hypothetical protein A2V72_01240 [Candidatus Nealsonbacteria bacterium RBG_13_37_56]